MILLALLLLLGMQQTVISQSCNLLVTCLWNFGTSLATLTRRDRTRRGESGCEETGRNGTKRFH